MRRNRKCHNGTTREECNKCVIAIMAPSQGVDCFGSTSWRRQGMRLARRRLAMPVLFAHLSVARIKSLGPMLRRRRPAGLQSGNIVATSQRSARTRTFCRPLESHQTPTKRTHGAARKQTAPTLASQWTLCKTQTLAPGPRGPDIFQNFWRAISRIAASTSICGPFHLATGRACAETTTLTQWSGVDWIGLDYSRARRVQGASKENGCEHKPVILGDAEWALAREISSN